MHLCIITSSFPIHRGDARAAAGLFVQDFALALAGDGHRVTVLTQDRKTGEAKKPPEGIEVHWFPWLGGKKPLSTLKPYNPIDALAMASLFKNGRRELERLAAEVRFDHVLAMWAVPAGWLARGLKKRRGIPYTTWCLGSDIWVYGKYPVLRQLVAAVLRDSDLLFADGLQLGNDASRLAAGRPCPFLPTSRRLDRALATSAAAGSGEAEEIRFLFLGRYAPVKGVDVLLEAMAMFLRQGHVARLQLLGGGPLESSLHQRAAEDDLRGHVSIGGFADERTVVSHMLASDCVVIPSRMESIPVVLSDAVQLGKPIIVSDVGDMGELLREYTAGLIVPPDNAEALCRAMIEMARTETGRFDRGVRDLAAKFDVVATARSWIDRL